MTTPTPPHLEFQQSPRGLRYLPPVGAVHGGQPAGHAQVYDSSSAAGVYLWLKVIHAADRNTPGGDPVGGIIHLPAEEAWKLADQIRFLVDQRGARPDWAQP
jgi:hypothetical protein